jgi:hypothetical protein
MAHSKDHLKDWWKPVLEMDLDDPLQEAPSWEGTNNVVLKTPFRGIKIKAFAGFGRKECGVFVSGVRKADVFQIQELLNRERSALLKELPKGTTIDTGATWPVMTRNELSSDDEKRAWIAKTLNMFVRALRPRLQQWQKEQRLHKH